MNSAICLYNKNTLMNVNRLFICVVSDTGDDIMNPCTYPFVKGACL